MSWMTTLRNSSNRAGSADLRGLAKARNCSLPSIRRGWPGAANGVSRMTSGEERVPRVSGSLPRTSRCQRSNSSRGPGGGVAFKDPVIVRLQLK